MTHQNKAAIEYCEAGNNYFVNINNMMYYTVFVLVEEL